VKGTKMTEEVKVYDGFELPKCIICNEEAEWTKFGKKLCTYHYDLANDHKRDRG